MRQSPLKNYKKNNKTISFQGSAAWERPCIAEMSLYSWGTKYILHDNNYTLLHSWVNFLFCIFPHDLFTHFRSLLSRRLGLSVQSACSQVWHNISMSILYIVCKMDNFRSPRPKLSVYCYWHFIIDATANLYSIYTVNIQENQLVRKTARHFFQTPSSGEFESRRNKYEDFVSSLCLNGRERIFAIGETGKQQHRQWGMNYQKRERGLIAGQTSVSWF